MVKAGQSQSKCIKASSLGQAARQNPCKSLKMNSFPNKQIESSLPAIAAEATAGQTMINLVKPGQNKPIPFGLGAVRHRHNWTVFRFRAGCLSTLPSAFPPILVWLGWFCDGILVP
jgi:hypothetical protein